MTGRDANLHGLLVVDKPRGPTSHDVVDQARRRFGTRRVGHGGTLDPMATGVLVLLFGEATKLSEIVAGKRKSYLAELSFGRATDSHDAMGRVTAELAAPDSFTLEHMEQVLQAEKQRTEQTPPAVSALKVGGHRAYAMTRAGSAPDLPPRPVEVSSLELRAFAAGRASIELCVSKGYYVRALARDVGSALAVPAHLSALRRTSSGCFTLEEALEWPPSEAPRLLSIAEALPRLARTLRLTADGVLRARRGQLLGAGDFMDEPMPAADDARSAGASLMAWTDAEGLPIALGERAGTQFRVRRGFAADLDSASLVPPSSRQPPTSASQTRAISEG
jgi:tRNA pseudouridine55 synthase